MLNRMCVCRWILRAANITRPFGFLVALFLCGIAAIPSWASGALEVSDSSLNFGNVAVGSNGAVSVNMKNAGRETIFFSQQLLRAKDFSVIGFEVPRALGPGHVLTFIIKFSPTYVGVFGGSLEVVSSASNRVVNLSLKGTGVSKSLSSTGFLSATPGSVNFENVPVGTTDTQSIQLINSGKTPVTISSLSVLGAGFKVAGLRLPHTLAVGSSVQLEAEFSPTRVASSTGKLMVGANSGQVTSTIDLTGTGISNSRSLLAPSSLSFGSVPVGKSATLNLNIQNVGNSDIKISDVSITGSGYSATGIPAGLTIRPQSTAVLSVELTPKVLGSIPGTITIVSNASNPQISVALSATAISASSHDIQLNWDASSSTDIEGYNIYRSTMSGGPYAKIVNYPVSGTEYIDATVLAGSKYYYVVTTVDDEGVESTPSNQAAVTVP